MTKLRLSEISVNIANDFKWDGISHIYLLLLISLLIVSGAYTSIGMTSFYTK